MNLIVTFNYDAPVERLRYFEGFFAHNGVLEKTGSCGVRWQESLDAFNAMVLNGGLKVQMAEDWQVTVQAGRIVQILSVTDELMREAFPSLF